MPRLKMSGVLPPLPHVFMSSHIISGTLFFLQIQLLLLLFTAYICLFCVTAFMEFPCVKYKSVILKKNLSLSIPICGCICTHNCL